MRQRVRLRVGGLSLLTAAVTAALLLMPASGSAAAPAPTVSAWNPQTTNVPYLAWAGEEVRLEKCIPLGDVKAAGVNLRKVSVNFLVEDWSDNSADIQKRAQIEDGSQSIFINSGMACASADAVSLYPGMARIEMDVIDTTRQLGYDPSSPVLKHQFLAGWMTLNDPTMTEMSASSFASTAQAEAAKELGDPSGNGVFNAGGGSGYLDVHVTGSMPTDAWMGLGLPASVTLPRDWPTLAQALATDDDPADSTPWTKWDTSGDSTGLEGHVIQSPVDCSAEPASEAGVASEPVGDDNGDNCTGGGPDGSFSTVFGTLSPAGSTIGPFDPVDGTDTLLSDGILNSQDAPMPATRIDVAIAPNSGGSTDISGVGSLTAADKTKTYSRDFLGDSSAHNLYAPFYDAYIPATTRGAISSGIDGAFANNFNGFLVNGEYHFWDIAASLASNTNTPTGCLQRSADPQSDSPLKNPGDFFQTPSGNSDVAVYTDQNGEAQVQYVPGTGFYFNSLINNGGAVLNANGGCDLQPPAGGSLVLGTSSITATAKYPFKPVSFLPMTSAPVTKTVTSLWSKTLAFFPKGSGEANSVSRIVVAHAQNIDGSPFAGEVVCFAADQNAESVSRFNGTVAGINLNGVGPAKDPKGGKRTCVTSDSNGNAAVEVLDSNQNAVDVVADFTNEGILRDISVNFAVMGSSGGTPPPPTSSSTPGTITTAPAPTSTSNSGTTAPTTAILRTVGMSGSSAGKSHKVKEQITILRLVSPAHGKHYVLIKVTSSASSAKVQLRLISAAGHVTVAGHHSKTTTRSETVKVQTNRQVKVTVSGTVRKIKAAKLLT
jgi:hypothetical protein